MSFFVSTKYLLNQIWPKIEEVPERNGNCLYLPDDVFEIILKLLNLKDCANYTCLCKKNLKTINVRPFTGETVNDLIEKIYSIPNRCFHGEKNIQIYKNYSFQIKNHDDFVFSCDDPNSKELNIPLEKIDFKIKRDLTNYYNTTCNSLDKMLFNQINANFDVVSLQLTDIDKELPHAIKLSLESVGQKIASYNTV